MSMPRPLWAIVEKFSKEGEQEYSAYRDARLLIIGEWAAALRAWDERMFVTSHLPLQAIDFMRERVLGVPLKEDEK